MQLAELLFICTKSLCFSLERFVRKRRKKVYNIEKVNHYKVILEPQEEGGYTVAVPALPGCISEGDTYEEALENIKEAIELYLESLTEDGLPIPEDKSIVAEVIV